MKITSKKFVALALAGAMAMGLLGTAQSASAEEVAGQITLTPSTGSATDDPFLQRIQVATGCPTGFRTQSGTFAFQGGVRMGSLADARTLVTPTTDGTTGLAGEPIDLNRVINPSNPHVSNKTLDAITTPLADGAWELRVYCFASATAPAFTDPYFALAMTFNEAAQTWAVGGTVVPPVVGEATTVSLTAGEAAGVGTVTATVKGATNATATAATGSVEFTQNGSVIATVPVASGVATYTSPVLTAGTYTYTAKFISSAPTVYANSPISGQASFTVPVGPAAPGSSNVTVTIPSNTGSLSFAGLAATIPLGTAALTGGNFVASGTLGPIVVTDTRQLGAANWSLTGQSTDFTDGAKSIDGKYLGWVPVLSGASNAGTAGPAVLPAPGSVNGIKSSSVLSSGVVVDGIQTTTTTAALNLVAPGNTRGGNYTATLTLTLI